MSFRTKLDFSSNRQVRQTIETFTELSGGTKFGVPFSVLPSGPDLTTTGETAIYNVIISTFSGNNTTTIYNWGYPEMTAGEISLSAITPTNSGETQFAGPVFNPSSSVIIDGNVVNTSYSGVSYDAYVTAMVDLGGGNYSGTVETDELIILSASSIDFTGRTIWVDVSGITRTEDLIITRNPVIGQVWTCIDSEGKGSWQPSSGSTGNTTLWSAGTGTYSLVPKNHNATAGGDYSLSVGQNVMSSGVYSFAMGENVQAIGISSWAFGNLTIANGTYSHAEGYKTIADGNYSHAEGSGAEASGDYSHAEGNNTKAGGNSSHSEGSNTQASGANSHAGGFNTIASGSTSFVHGNTSEANGINTIVLGANITGNTDNTTYVDYLNIKNILATASVNDIRIDANGNLTTNTSDIRLKENINPISGALNKIKQLEGVSYQWKDRNAGGDTIRLGFIAQQVEEVEPLLVFTNKDENQYKGIHIDGVIPLLVEAVKEIASGNNVYLETQTILAEDNNIDLNFNGNQETAITGGIRVLHAKGIDNPAEFIIDSSGDWVTNNSVKPKSLVIPEYTPLSTNDEYGNIGDIVRDENYIYVKTNLGWKRTNLETF